ncbi:Atg8-like protein 1 [Trypanosoma rangeli]|uniref:Autophagy-related protein n=1 Tax=Trypanosoma rangeli TaxID=5698 RepID=A0A422NM79_TRYRA|nr:Atg8-like protein 1 [Trypanosoma rangeli]RNF06536.1 Atg8-like protein 1 [Trypanosoma rangeli]|eukprot:RNF06536.1 Atg8-like protein 1 [Trypanosoma rangeli]
MVRKGFESKYKKTHNLEYRLSEAAKVRDKNPDRIPIICEKVDGSGIGDLERGKFLVPSDLTVGQFVLVLRKRVTVEADEAIFLFVNGAVPPTTAQMSDLYAQHKDEDGFLYIKYSGEATFGSR